MNGQVKIYSGARTCPGRSWKNNRITRRGKIRGRKKKGGKGRERERERGRLPFQGVRTIDHGKGLLFKRTFVRDAVGFAIFPLSLSVSLFPHPLISITLPYLFLPGLSLSLINWPPIYLFESLSLQSSSTFLLFIQFFFLLIFSVFRHGIFHLIGRYIYRVEIS